MAVGTGVLKDNTTASNNTAVGYRAGTSANGADGLAFLGTFAGRDTTTGSAGTAVGYAALIQNTTGANNTSIGYQSLFSNTTASNNTAVGYQAGYSNTTGTNLVAIGESALRANTTAIDNIAIGVASLLSCTTANYNVAIGTSALRNVITTAANVAIGYQALQNNTGSDNVALGFRAGVAATGIGNTFIGENAGSSATSGDVNLMIGRNCQKAAITDSNEMVIASANTITGKGSSTGFINANGGNIFQGNNSASWATTSDQRLKKNIVDNTDGLAKITAIQVRNFEYRTADEVTDLPQEQAIQKEGVQLGVIAQELQQVLPECVKTETTGVLTVDTDNLTWYLINAVKELNAKVDSLKQQLGK